MIRDPADWGAVALIDLEPDECRYPTLSDVDRGEHLFCGAPKDPESDSYCKKHHFECHAITGARLHRFAR